MSKTILQNNTSSNGDEVIKVEFNIVYSISYEVPVLYFSASKQGNNKSLQIDIFNVFSSIHDSMYQMDLVWKSKVYGKESLACSKVVVKIRYHLKNLGE